MMIHLHLVSLLALALRVSQISAFVAPSTSRVAFARSNLPLKTVQDPVASSEKDPTKEESNSGRPFHQQWWPVAAVSSLKKDRPNALQLLGKSLVTFWDGSNWKILDDLCSHRFAPLSEGRVVDCHLQCAYHGWEFNSEGKCTKVPQQPSQTAKARPVQSYPVREDISMLWVWMDPKSYESLGASIPLPINPYLRDRVEEMGPNSCFQRDLPYGMEILGENLLDLSHLPFAHHSVGNLNRDLGGDLPTRMLSKEEKVLQGQWEKEFVEDKGQHTAVLPVFQAEIVDAAQHDPLLKMMAKQVQDSNSTKSWSTTIGYYDPCHVRYRRDRGESGFSHVELFFCPTAEGKSRVFLFNLFRRQPASPPPDPATASLIEKIVYLCKPSTWKEKAFQALLKKILTSERGHIMSHSIFDGDGIFLHKQGNRMKNANLTFRDYSTPSSADILLNAYRRFLDQAAQQTRAADLETMAESVVGTSAYGNDAPRSLLLDRYNTHTKDCPLCLPALQKARRKLARVKVLRTAANIAVGTSSLGLVCLLLLLKYIEPWGYLSLVDKPLLRKDALALVASVVGSLAARRSEQKLQKQINGFIFEDYVHADKN